MPLLRDPALRAILNEWNPRKYDPPNTDVGAWTHAIESLCDAYGIPDTQRAQCAVKFVNDEVRDKLEQVLADARATLGPTHWDRFKIFMIAFDRHSRLPFYQKHAKLIGTTVGVVGCMLLAPVAIVGALSSVGFTSAGVAAGSVAASIQSIVYGGATGGLFSLLQSAGATMALSSGTIVAGVTGVATTGSGIAVMSGESVTTPDRLLLSSSIGQGDGDDHDQDYLLTLLALQAIVKSWDVTAYYNPPSTDAAGWLDRVHNLCKVYEVPIGQQARCAVHYMRADCREVAEAAGCNEMTWDEFKLWLRQYDGMLLSVR